MKTKAIPEGFHSLTPDLVVRDAAEAIEFYKRVFGAKKRRVFHGPDGSIVHAEIQIGDSILFLSPEFPEHKVFSPQSPEGGTSTSMFFYVEDVDAVFAKAVSAGATVTMPLADAFWGDRAGGIVDPFGHRWMLAMHIKDISDKELEKAAKAMFAKKP
ncbi:MAG: VOC family protein [Candidatus Methanoperedens sp.]|nr:VOC family protein [Candidatus Methanoperedens sp.]MCZ7369280.1 VOC family protein [Candidatus Methanoperedens sp.]